MNDTLRIALLRSAVLTLLPEHVLADGRCACGVNCAHQQALSILDLTRPFDAYTVPAFTASLRTSENGPYGHERTLGSTETPDDETNAHTGTLGALEG